MMKLNLPGGQERGLTEGHKITFELLFSLIRTVCPKLLIRQHTLRYSDGSCW